MKVEWSLRVPAFTSFVAKEDLRGKSRWRVPEMASCVANDIEKCLPASLTRKDVASKQRHLAEPIRAVRPQFSVLQASTWSCFEGVTEATDRRRAAE